jgi:twitching motility protein PilI
MGERSRTHLRDFQARLSDRLRRASSADVAARLGLMIGEDRYLVDLAEAGEIVPIPETMTPVPLSRDWLRGLVNLRGVLYAVSDLGRFQGGAATTLSRESRLLAVASRLNFNAAILVTRMLGLHNVTSMKETAFQAPNAPWKRRQLADSEGRIWTELSLSQLVADERFLLVNR